jgi:hypothetical protein
VENLGEFFVAILTEKNVVRHGQVLLNVSSHMVARLVVPGRPQGQDCQRVIIRRSEL